MVLIGSEGRLCEVSVLQVCVEFRADMSHLI